MKLGAFAIWKHALATTTIEITCTSISVNVVIKRAPSTLQLAPIIDFDGRFSTYAIRAVEVALRTIIRVKCIAEIEFNASCLHEIFVITSVTNVVVVIIS